MAENNVLVLPVRDLDLPKSERARTRFLPHAQDNTIRHCGGNATTGAPGTYTARFATGKWAQQMNVSWRLLCLFSNDHHVPLSFPLDWLRAGNVDALKMGLVEEFITGS